MAKNNVNIDLDDNDDFIPSPLALNDFSHFFQYFDLQTVSISDNEADHDKFVCYSDIDFTVQTNT